MALRKSVIQPGWANPVLASLRSLIELTGGLSVFATTAGSRVPASVGNAGLIADPSSGLPVVAHVAYGDSLRVSRLLNAPSASVTFYDGRQWLTVEGNARIVFAPWDERAAQNCGDWSATEEQYSELLRNVYLVAGGGEHEDWVEYDRAMRRELRVVVFLDVNRLYGICGE